MSNCRFLAGLRCDGTEKEPDEDPLTCTLFDESDQGNLCPTSNNCTENNNEPKESSVTLTSQDNETDVNLELESISKEDDESFTKSKLFFKFKSKFSVQVLIVFTIFP